MAEKPQEHWYEAAANTMIREGVTLFKYSNLNDLGLTSTECENIVRTKRFQEILRVQRNLYHKELATDSSLTRAAVEGQLVLAISKLLENQVYDKAATAIMQYAKLKGWTSDAVGVNIFQELAGGDFEKMRARLKAQIPAKKELSN